MAGREPDISKEHMTSIFRIEEYVKQGTTVLEENIST
jgi:hypothetical protein